MENITVNNGRQDYNHMEHRDIHNNNEYIKVYSSLLYDIHKIN